MKRKRPFEEKEKKKEIGKMVKKKIYLMLMKR
jgi:hypothetical protein